MATVEWSERRKSSGIARRKTLLQSTISGTSDDVREIIIPPGGLDEAEPRPSIPVQQVVAAERAKPKKKKLKRKKYDIEQLKKKAQKARRKEIREKYTFLTHSPEPYVTKYTKKPKKKIPRPSQLMPKEEEPVLPKTEKLKHRFSRPSTSSEFDINLDEEAFFCFYRLSELRASVEVPRPVPSTEPPKKKAAPPPEEEEPSEDRLRKHDAKADAVSESKTEDDDIEISTVTTTPIVLPTPDQPEYEPYQKAEKMKEAAKESIFQIPKKSIFRRRKIVPWVFPRPRPKRVRHPTYRMIYAGDEGPRPKEREPIRRPKLKRLSPMYLRHKRIPSKRTRQLVTFLAEKMDLKYDKMPPKVIRKKEKPPQVRFSEPRYSVAPPRHFADEMKNLVHRRTLYGKPLGRSVVPEDSVGDRLISPDQMKDLLKSMSITSFELEMKRRDGLPANGPPVYTAGMRDTEVLRRANESTVDFDRIFFRPNSYVIEKTGCPLEKYIPTPRTHTDEWDKELRTEMDAAKAREKNRSARAGKGYEGRYTPEDQFMTKSNRQKFLPIHQRDPRRHIVGPGVHNGIYEPKKPSTLVPTFEWGRCRKDLGKNVRQMPFPDRHNPPTDIQQRMTRFITERGPYDVMTGPRDNSTLTGFWKPRVELSEHQGHKTVGVEALMKKTYYGRWAEAPWMDPPPKNYWSPPPNAYTIEPEKPVRRNKYGFNISSRYPRQLFPYSFTPGPGRYRIRYKRRRGVPCYSAFKSKTKRWFPGADRPRYSLLDQ